MDGRERSLTLVATNSPRLTRPSASGRMTLERLPAYAPELNPAEGVWGNVKWHRMANHGLTEVDAIHAMAKREGRKVAGDQQLLKSFIRATPLPIRLPGR